MSENGADAEKSDTTIGTEGFGACTKCSCKGYNPTRAYGTCEATRDDGSTVCGHYNTAHKEN